MKIDDHKTTVAIQKHPDIRNIDNKSKSRTRTIKALEHKSTANSSV